MSQKYELNRLHCTSTSFTILVCEDDSLHPLYTEYDVVFYIASGGYRHYIRKGEARYDMTDRIVGEPTIANAYVLLLTCLNSETKKFL